MTCDELMSDGFVVVEPAARVDHVARRMRKRGVGIAVVTDGNGHARGVLTHRDIAERVCADRVAAQGARASEYMSRPVLSCRPTDSLETALERMELHGVGHILVTTGRREELLGLVELSAIALEVDPDLVATTLHGIHQRQRQSAGLGEVA